MANILEVRGLTVALPPSADRANAVDGIDLAVGEREIVCVVGESGSGKSVTAFSVMGLLAPELRVAGGSVKLQGEELIGASPERLRELRGTRMTMIFQEPMTALNPTHTVGAQIEEVFQVHQQKSAGDHARRVLELMKMVRLRDPESMRHAYPHQLSGGQRQRIMIAMALAMDPALLVADEPTTALDVTTQAQILAEVKEIQREHATGVLFITHDFGVVAEIADRVAVMREGRIVEQGPVEEVLMRPRHPYTRMLIAAVPGVRRRPRARIASDEVALETRRLTKTFRSGGFFQKKREVHAVAEVDVKLRRGETLGIVGESGSGKSTVARCVTRLIDPSGGEVWLHGAEISRAKGSALRPLRKRIQIVFQDPYRSLNPRHTVGWCLTEGPVNYGVRRAQALERAAELMGLVGLDPAAIDRYPHQFSGGQRQRLCIARALMMDPEVLVADEAVSALDVSVQAQVLELLDQIRRRFSIAMLFITHDLRVAAEICDNIAVMHQGKVVEYGDTAEIFANPLHDYTRALFDASPGRGWDFQKALAYIDSEEREAAKEPLSPQLAG